VVTTARRVFPHVGLIGNVVVASYSPLDIDPVRAKLRLQQHPLLQDPAALDAVMAQSVLVTKSDPGHTIAITDNQMNEEFGNKPDRKGLSRLDLVH
jgi:hypothetical protein